MHIVKKDEFFKNINSEYDIPIEIQKKLMNGNAQFIMDLAFNLKMYTYVSKNILKIFFRLVKVILLHQLQYIYVIFFFIKDAI